MELNKSTRFKKSFDNSFMLLRAVDQPNVRDHIKAACGWGSDGTFSMKKNGDRAMDEKDWLIITDIFANYGIDANNECLIEDQAS